ncbi:hypothetical protein KIPB_011079, partial [Kipferlia bialata]|eukprot:g11079.t1
MVTPTEARSKGFLMLCVNGAQTGDVDMEASGVSLSLHSIQERPTERGCMWVQDELLLEKEVEDALSACSSVILGREHHSGGIMLALKDDADAVTHLVALDGESARLTMVCTLEAPIAGVTEMSAFKTDVLLVAPADNEADGSKVTLLKTVTQSTRELTLNTQGSEVPASLYSLSLSLSLSHTHTHTLSL